MLDQLWEEAVQQSREFLAFIGKDETDEDYTLTLYKLAGAHYRMTGWAYLTGGRDD